MHRILSEEELGDLSHQQLVTLALELQARVVELEGVNAPKRKRTPQGASGAPRRLAPLTDQPSASARPKAAPEMPGTSTSVHMPGGESEPARSHSEELARRATAPRPTGLDAEEADHTPRGSRPAKLVRGISRIPANVAAASQLRAELVQAVGYSQTAGTTGLALKPALSHSTFFLPSLEGERPGFREYIHSKLTAPHYQQALEEDEVLNWAVKRGHLTAEHRLFVLWTLSDGNCLLHATLLAMWGLHDTHMVGASGLSSIRSAMSQFFVDPIKSIALHNRWERQLARDSAWRPDTKGKDSPPAKVEVTESQMERDWAEMVEIAGRQNAFLDSVHVLAVAHALCRPLVVVAPAMQTDHFGVPLTPLFFRGIYLPFECPPELCCKQPLILCFKDAHFMPVVPVRGAATQVRVPLADGTGEELPLRFATDDEMSQKWEVVAKYMDTERVNFPSGDCQVAIVHRSTAHPLVEEMLDQFVEVGSTTFDAEREEETEAKRRLEQEAAARHVKEKEERRKKAATELQQGSSDSMDEDVLVSDRFDVKLAESARPGDRMSFVFPKGCTVPAKTEFQVPPGCFGGTMVTLTSKFKIKGSSISQVCEVTSQSREDATKLLAKAHGDVNVAVEKYFGLG